MPTISNMDAFSFATSRQKIGQEDNRPNVGIFAATLLDFNLQSTGHNGGFSIPAVVIGVIVNVGAMIAILQVALKYSSRDSLAVFSVFVPCSLLVVGGIFALSWSLVSA